MKKFFILILSAILCSATSVFAMDLPYNEEYHKLPTLSIDIIEHQLSVEDVTLLGKISRKKDARFKTGDGQVYEIGKDQYPVLEYLWRKSPSESPDERMITWLSSRCPHIARKPDNGTICHQYMLSSLMLEEDYWRYLPRKNYTEKRREFEATGLTFKKVNPQEYWDWSYNLTPEEKALFPTIYPNPTPKHPLPKQHEEDEWLRSFVTLNPDPEPAGLLQWLGVTLGSKFGLGS